MSMQQEQAAAKMTQKPKRAQGDAKITENIVSGRITKQKNDRI